MLGAEEYGDLVGRIYEAAAIPELWADALNKLASVANCAGGVLFVNSGQQTSWVATPVLEPIFQRMLDGGWMNRNDRLNGMLAKGGTGFVRDQDLFDHDNLHEVPMYRDFLIPEGLGWGAATFVNTIPGDSVVLTMERRYEAGPVDPAAIRMLDTLRPHIARAGILSAVLKLDKAQASLDAFEIAGAPAALIGSGGRVVATNRPFEALDRQIIARAHGRLAFRDEAASRALSEAIARINHDNADDVRSIALPSVDGEPACVLHIVPVRRHARDVFARSEALIIASHEGKTLAISASVLCELYDLTRAEAAVAQELLQGRSIAEIAALRGRSIETVRSQVKVVLAKTGCPSQLDFVRRLAPLAL